MANKSLDNTFREITFRHFIPGIAWFLLILFLMCLPGRDIPSVGWLEEIHFDKMVHMGSFMVMTFLFSWIFYKSKYSSTQRLYYFIRIALATSIWGLTIEFIQRFYIPGRAYELLDWAADSLGSLIGFFLSWKYLLRP